MRRRLTVWAALAALTLASTALAEGQSWSAVGPKTLSSSGNSIEATVGWPGLGVAWQRGVASRVNLGARLGFVYGVEGLVRHRLAPGLKLQVLTKFLLLDEGRVSLGVTFEPGPLFHFYPHGGTLAGFSLPVGFRLGVAASSALQLALLFDLPFWLTFGPGASFQVPILTGIGVEYFIKSDLLVLLRLRMGPTLYYRAGAAEFTLESVVGLGWRF